MSTTVDKFNKKLDVTRQLSTDIIQSIDKRSDDGAVLTGHNALIHMFAYLATIGNDKTIVVTKGKFLPFIEQILANYDDVFQLSSKDISNYDESTRLITVKLEDLDNDKMTNLIKDSKRILLYNRNGTLTEPRDSSLFWRILKKIPLFIVKDDGQIIEKNVHFDTLRYVDYIVPWIADRRQVSIIYWDKKELDPMRIHTTEKLSIEPVKVTINDSNDQFNEFHDKVYNDIVKTIEFKKLENFELKGLELCPYNVDEKDETSPIRALIKRGKCKDVASALDRSLELLELYTYYPKVASDELQFSSEEDTLKSEKLNKLLSVIDQGVGITCVIISDHPLLHNNLKSDITNDRVVFLDRKANIKSTVNTVKKRLSQVKKDDSTTFIISEKQFRLFMNPDFLRFHRVHVFSSVYTYNTVETERLQYYLIDPMLKNAITIYDGNNRMDRQLSDRIGNRKKEMKEFYDNSVWNSTIDYDDLLLIDTFILNDGRIREPDLSAFRNYSIRELTPYEKLFILEEYGDRDEESFDIGISLSGILKGAKNLLGKINLKKLSKRARELLQKIDFKKLSKTGTALFETLAKLAIKDLNLPELVLMAASDQEEEALFLLAQRLPKSSKTIAKTGLSTFGFAKALIEESNVVVEDIKEKEGKEFIEEIKKEEEKEKKKRPPSTKPESDTKSEDILKKASKTGKGLLKGVDKLSKLAEKLDFEKLTVKGVQILILYASLAIDFNIVEIVSLVAQEKTDEAAILIGKKLADPKVQGKIIKAGFKTAEFGALVIDQAIILAKEIKKQEEEEKRRKAKDVSGHIGKMKWPHCHHHKHFAVFTSAVIGDEISLKMADNDKTIEATIVSKEDDEDEHMIWVVKPKDSDEVYDVYDDGFDHFEIKTRLSKERAQEILADGTIYGRKLSAAERRFFASVAYGKKPRRKRKRKKGRRKRRRWGYKKRRCNKCSRK